jgi:hypothetical protein
MTASVTHSANTSAVPAQYQPKLDDSYKKRMHERFAEYSKQAKEKIEQLTKKELANAPLVHPATTSKFRKEHIAMENQFHKISNELRNAQIEKIDKESGKALRKAYKSGNEIYIQVTGELNGKKGSVEVTKRKHHEVKIKSNLNKNSELYKFLVKQGKKKLESIIK